MVSFYLLSSYIVWEGCADRTKKQTEMCRLSDGFIFLKKLLGMDRKNLTNIFFYINKKKNLESRKNKKANFKKNKF